MRIDNQLIGASVLLFFQLVWIALFLFLLFYSGLSQAGSADPDTSLRIDRVGCVRYAADAFTVAVLREALADREDAHQRIITLYQHARDSYSDKIWPHVLQLIRQVFHAPAAQSPMQIERDFFNRCMRKGGLLELEPIEENRK